MADKTEDTQPDIFIGSEKQRLTESVQQESERGRERKKEWAGLGVRQQHAWPVGQRRMEGGGEGESVWLSAREGVCVCVYA